MVELDAQMKVVREVHLTNLLQLAVRDSLVAVSAIVRATSDVGFVSPDTRIKNTLKAANSDDLAVYVMGRDFKYKKHGLIEATAQTTLAPNALLLGANGGVYLSLAAGGDLTYQGMPIVNWGRVTGTMISKLGVALAAGLFRGAKAKQARLRMGADGRLSIYRAGSYRYTLTNLK